MRWQDFGNVDFFGAGRATTEDMLSHYSIESTQLTAMRRFVHFAG